jgi:hypothetical protein
MKQYAKLMTKRLICLIEKENTATKIYTLIAISS